MYLRNAHWEDPIFLDAAPSLCLMQPEEKLNEKIGVYVIWSVEDSTVIYVGSSGDSIFKRFKYHLTNAESPVKRFKDKHKSCTLKAAYIEIQEQTVLQGIENYLGYVYQPKPIPTENREYPDRKPYEVNLLPDEYFETPFIPKGVHCNADLSNWEEYTDAFEKWAVGNQNRDSDTYEKSEKGICDL